MALNPSNGSNLEHLALKGLTKQRIMGVIVICNLGVTLLSMHAVSVTACRSDGKFTDSQRVFASLMAGGVAGVVSWMPAIPFDVVKSLIQV